MSLPLAAGARVGVIGGGPAGSLFAYFCLTFAERMDLPMCVDIYEPRDFTQSGPGGCNMCGGIVSESLVQALCLEGIVLPEHVVQRGIDSYVLHTDARSVRIETPLREKRIAAVHRGGGPRGLPRTKWGGLDGFLLAQAQRLGATVVPARVSEVTWVGDRPAVSLPGRPAQPYDLLVGATGVNSNAWQLFERLGLPSRRYATAKTYITELKLEATDIAQYFGNAMHVFMLNMPRLDCAAIIPKGDFLTLCLLGRDVDRDLIDAFFATPAVRRCFPAAVVPADGTCHCSPKINVHEATRPFCNRVVLVGDCGVTRLYKDGIGAAYRTAKAAARTAVFAGVAASDFERYYWPLYRSIARDNWYGRLIFAVVHLIKAMRPAVQGLLRMAAREQDTDGAGRRMSIVLWDMFTGSAPYREIFFRTVDPRFLGRFVWASIVAAGRERRTRPA